MSLTAVAACAGSAAARVARHSVRPARACAIALAGAILAGCAGELSGSGDVTGGRTSGVDGGEAIAAGANDRGESQVSIAPPATGFDSDAAWDHLRRQVEFGPRPAGSEALARTRRYIMEQLAASGIEAREQAFTARTPLGDIAMANVIGTIPGRRTDRIGLASHYDTKLERDFRFVGANDSASSTAVVLELGRVLAGRDNEFTIELLFFDGEEALVEWYRDNDNTYGSRHYVQTAQRDGTLSGMKALVLLDMVGDRNLMIRRDSNSTPWLVDIIWDAAARLGYRQIFSNELTTIEDDHIPFLRAGIPAVDVIDLDYPPWHTADDDLDQVSARSLQIVGEVILASWPEIERHLVSPLSRR